MTIKDIFAEVEELKQDIENLSVTRPIRKHPSQPSAGRRHLGLNEIAHR